MNGRSSWRASSTERQISSSVSSRAMRSSCCSSLSTSPETRAPRSRLVLLSLLKRSRSLSSASPGMREQPQQLGDRRLQLRARNDGVEVAEAVVGLGEPEVVRQLLSRRLLHDAWTGERHERAGLGDENVAETREACEQTAGGRVREHRYERCAR